MIRVHCDICDGLIPENLSGDSITFDEKINGVVYEIQMYLRGSVIRKEDKNLRLFSNTKRLVLCRDCLSELAMKYSRDIIPQPIFKLVKNNKEADKNNAEPVTGSQPFVSVMCKFSNVAAEPHDLAAKQVRIGLEYPYERAHGSWLPPIHNGWDRRAHSASHPGPGSGGRRPRV